MLPFPRPSNRFNIITDPQLVRMVHICTEDALPDHPTCADCVPCSVIECSGSPLHCSKSPHHSVSNDRHQPHLDDAPAHQDLPNLSPAKPPALDRKLPAATTPSTPKLSSPSPHSNQRHDSTTNHSHHTHQHHAPRPPPRWANHHTPHSQWTPEPHAAASPHPQPPPPTPPDTGNPPPTPPPHNETAWRNPYAPQHRHHAADDEHKHSDRSYPTATPPSPTIAVPVSVPHLPQYAPARYRHTHHRHPRSHSARSRRSRTNTGTPYVHPSASALGDGPIPTTNPTCTYEVDFATANAFLHAHVVHYPDGRWTTAGVGARLVIDDPASPWNRLIVNWYPTTDGVLFQGPLNTAALATQQLRDWLTTHPPRSRRRHQHPYHPIPMANPHQNPQCPHESPPWQRSIPTKTKKKPTLPSIPNQKPRTQPPPTSHARTSRQPSPSGQSHLHRQSHHWKEDHLPKWRPQAVLPSRMGWLRQHPRLLGTSGNAHRLQRRHCGLRSLGCTGTPVTTG